MTLGRCLSSCCTSPEDVKADITGSGVVVAAIITGSGPESVDEAPKPKVSIISSIWERLAGMLKSKVHEFQYNIYIFIFMFIKDDTG